MHGYKPPLGQRGFPSLHLSVNLSLLLLAGLRTPKASTPTIMELMLSTQATMERNTTHAHYWHANNGYGKEAEEIQCCA